MIVLWFIVIILWLGAKACGGGETIHISQIQFPPCRPCTWPSTGIVRASSYFDKKGRKRYCCNPHHNHCW